MTTTSYSMYDFLTTCEVEGRQFESIYGCQVKKSHEMLPYKGNSFSRTCKVPATMKSQSRYKWFRAALLLGTLALYAQIVIESCLKLLRVELPGSVKNVGVELCDHLRLGVPRISLNGFNIPGA